MENFPSCDRITSQPRQAESSAVPRIYQEYVRLEAVYTWEGSVANFAQGAMKGQLDLSV
jgi:hypothetical protein